MSDDQQIETPIRKAGTSAQAPAVPGSGLFCRSFPPGPERERDRLYWSGQRGDDMWLSLVPVFATVPAYGLLLLRLSCRG